MPYSRSMSLKLKLLRVQAGMTLEELAQAAELTRSYVSKLERGVSTPSVSTALKLAKALKVRVEEVFSASPEDDPVVIKRRPAGAAQGPDPRVVSSLAEGRRITAFVLNPSDAPMRNHPMSHHRGEELLYVLKGRVALRLAGRTEELGAGDSAHFDATIPHKIASVGATPASVLLVIATEA